jgi:hypothetical protein
VRENETSRIYKALERGAQGRFRGCPLDWMEGNILLPHSARATRFDRAVAPWLNEIVLAFASGDFRQIGVRAPVGGGKTTLLELLVPYVVAEDPGGMLLVGQSDDMAKDFAETRLLPILQTCKQTAALFPHDRHQKRKTSILFPHMPLFIAGANLSSLQEKSMRYVWMDELWRWRPGMIGEAQRRTHDRWNSVVIGVSQGWDESHEASAFFDSGELRCWGVECPGCQQWQRLTWSGIKWDDHALEDGTPDWEAISASVRHECPTCGHVTRDTAQERRALASRGRYARMPSNSLAQRVSFHYSALAVYWIPWGTLVVEWLKAQILKKAGDVSALRQFIQKRLAEVWREENDLPPVELRGADYSKEEFIDGARIDGEVRRFLTIDRQLDHWWALCRAWRADGTSRLIWEGKVLTLESLRDLQQRLRVEDYCTFQDAGYDSGNVYDECGNYDWNAMLGRGDDFFWIGSGKMRHQRAYSEPRPVRSPRGHICKLILFANEPVKDQLVRLRGKGAPEWEHPRDVSPDWLTHMNSELKRDVVDKITKRVRQRYVLVKKHNHLWDCEAMQLVAAMYFRILSALDLKE